MNFYLLSRKSTVNIVTIFDDDRNKTACRQILLSHGTEVLLRSGRDPSSLQMATKMPLALPYLFMLVHMEVVERFNGVIHSIHDEYDMFLKTHQELYDLNMITCPREVVRYFHRHNSCSCLKEIYYHLKDNTKRTTYCSKCKKIKDIREMMTDIGSIRKRWFKDVMPSEFEEYFKTENKLEYMRDSLSDFMVHSFELGNSSHYDVDDRSLTVSTWVEDVIGNTDNWYFVLPNITRDNNNAIVIQLFHGCTISWDARIIRHASSKPSYRIRGGGRNNPLTTSAGNCELRKKRTAVV